MEISSSVFKDGDLIPARYTCDGDNVSPPLKFSGVPESTKTLALIMDDPDVPKHLRPDGMWVHWVVWNIDPSTASIDEDAVPKGAMQGVSSSGMNRYGGPCPPDREHRYFFKLYALDDVLSLPPATDKAMLEEAMAGHIVATAELMGKYDRRNR